MKCYLTLIIVLTVQFSCISCYTIVWTKNGGLDGYTMRTIRQRPIWAFEGIPYGQDTGGRNRFKMPIPARPWSGIRQAKKKGNRCPQFRPGASEDCLYMNVYTPKIPLNNAKPNLPVLVEIHAGLNLFSDGGEFGPYYLLDEDVILVSFNYRLGILGFLSTSDSVIPPNLGLHDQVLALKWVHENIASFGGDPSRVTLIGESTGAVAVHLHMISKLSRKYFSSAISRSGTAFNSWAVLDRNMSDIFLRKVTLMFGCPLGNSTEPKTQEFVKCMSKIDHRTLGRRVVPLLWGGPIIGPVIEEDRPGAFLTKSPDKAYRDGDVAKYPYMCTRVMGESEQIITILRLMRAERMIKTLWGAGGPIGLAQYFLTIQFATNNPDEVSRKLNEYYIGTDLTWKNFAKYKNLSGIREMMTDRMSYGIHKTLQAHSTIAPTYSYLFNYKGSIGYASKLHLNPKDYTIVGHGEDILMLFNMSRVFPVYKVTDREYKVIHLLTNLISNFAKTGEPLYTNPSGKLVKIWEPVPDPRNIRMLEITNEVVKMVDEPHLDRLKFWETLGLSDVNPWVPID